MKLTITCLIAAIGFAAAAVRIAEEQGVFTVSIDGQPFGALYTGADAPKPYFSPFRSATGRIVTRQWPMVNDLGETRDHQHHRGMWLGYIDVNGFNFWENEFSYHRANAGRIVSRRVSVENGNGIRGEFAWLDPAGNELLRDSRTLTFSGTPELRIVDFEATLTAVVKSVFGDDKDGMFAVRLADPLTEKKTGVILNSAGQRTMKEAWGKPANWVDYSGTLDGENVGITMMEHPSSFHHPSRWHARDYGLLAVNPIAVHAYDPSLPPRPVTLMPGQTMHLRFRVVAHPKMDAPALEKLYREFAALKEAANIGAR